MTSEELLEQLPIDWFKDLGYRARRCWMMFCTRASI